MTARSILLNTNFFSKKKMRAAHLVGLLTTFLFGCLAVVWCNDRPRNWHRLPVQRPPIGAGRIDDGVSCYMLFLPVVVPRDICFSVVTGGHRRWLLLHPSARDAVRQIQDGVRARYSFTK